MAEVRRLGIGDGPDLLAFLEGHCDSALYLLANLHQHGIGILDDARAPRYAGAFESGRIVATASHVGNGLILLQAPGADQTLVQDLVSDLAAARDRRVEGFLGPWPEVAAATTGFNTGGRATRLRVRGQLQHLPLDNLQTPKALSEGAVHCRYATEADLERLAQWRADYNAETMAAPPGPGLLTRSREQVRRLQRDKTLWVLDADRHLAAMLAINVRYGERLLIGGAFTPPALRGRGFGRALLAGALQAEGRAGRTRALLVVDSDNTAARRAYAGLGFAGIGDFGMVLYAGARL